MNPSDAGQVLRACSFFDNRKVTKEAMLAWGKALGDRCTLADALQAVVDHHAETDTYCGPSHVIERARKLRRERFERTGPPPMPGGLELADEKRWRRTWLAAVNAGADDPTVVADTALGIARVELPPNPEMAKAIESLASGSKGVR